MSELHDFALIVLVVAGIVSLAFLATRLSSLIRVPAAVVLLLAAALASDASSDLRHALSIRDVERIAVVALIVILLNGGIDIGWQRFRNSAGAVLSLGILGTFATAAIIAVAAHVLLGLEWELAGVLGAALAPTDPAVMFSVLGGREIRGRSGTMLEGEAGFNDPAGIALMIGMIELATHADASLTVVLVEFAKEMAIGAAAGFAAAEGFRRARLGEPIFLLMLAGVLFGITGVLGGSGFLAVFIVGLRLDEVTRRDTIHALAGLAEVIVFIALGLTIGITDLPGGTWLDGLVMAVVIALVARPAAVALTLARADLRRNERLFIAWSGLKGAVPILLAAFAVLGEVDGADRLYGIVFVVVALSVLVQGTLVPWVASRLDVSA